LVWEDAGPTTLDFKTVRCVVTMLRRWISICHGKRQFAFYISGSAAQGIIMNQLNDCSGAILDHKFCNKLLNFAH